MPPIRGWRSATFYYLKELGTQEAHENTGREIWTLARENENALQTRGDPNMMIAMPMKHTETPTQSVAVGLTASTIQSQTMATPT